jgi:hypothetical protein
MARVMSSRRPARALHSFGCVVDRSVAEHPGGLSRVPALVFALVGLVVLAATVGCGGSSTSDGPSPGENSAGAKTGGTTLGQGGGRSAGGASGGTAPGQGGGMSAARGGASGLEGGSGGAGSGGRAADACAAPLLPESPLRRLTQIEFDNTVREVFDVDQLPLVLFPPEPRDEPGLGRIGARHIELYHQFAHDFAIQATSSAEALDETTDCDLMTEGEAACKERLFARRIAPLWRRPLDAEERSDLDEVFAKGAELAGGFAGGVRAVLEVALQSPEFVYHLEFGEPLDVPADDPRAGWGRPTAYEMASRLSYLYWEAPPDDELVQAAERGGLRSRDEIREQAARLLADEAAKRMTRPFYFNLLGIPHQPWQATGEGALTAEIQGAMLSETAHFVDHATFGDPGDFASLLTDPTTWVNEELATYYGIPGVTGEAFVRVELDSTRRGGILTQGSFLVSHTTPGSSHPFFRGLRIFAQLLCQELPAPPVVVDLLPLENTSDMTTRQRFETVNTQPECAQCHRETQQLGYALEHFDHLGLWRDTDNGRPVDATGTLVVTDAAGSFNGAVELAGLIAASRDAKRCFASKWLTHAYGRALGSADACSRDQVERAFTEGRIRELLVAIALSDGFLYRPLGGP